MSRMPRKMKTSEKNKDFLEKYETGNASMSFYQSSTKPFTLLLGTATKLGSTLSVHRTPIVQWTIPLLQCHP